MSTNERQYDETDKKILTATISLLSNILFNDFALENIVLKKITPGSNIPYNLYLEELQLKPYEIYLSRKSIAGGIIDEEEKIRIKPNQEYFTQYYIEQVNCIFKNAPKHKYTSDSLLIFPFKYDLKNYLQELYFLFEEIIDIKIEAKFFDLISNINSRVEMIANNKLSQRFIAAIKLKKLRQGSRVDRYIKDIPCPSDLLKKLYCEKNGHYILVCNDVNNIKYKLALLSCFSFHTTENQKLFELKIKKWEEKYNKKSNTKRTLI